jgi:hypothetical protein
LGREPAPRAPKHLPENEVFDARVSLFHQKSKFFAQPLKFEPPL